MCNLECYAARHSLHQDQKNIERTAEMAAVLRKSNSASAPSRSGEWTEIREITETLRRLDVGCTKTALTIDHTIQPHLPSGQACIGAFATKTGQHLSLLFEKVLQTRIDQLRQQMLQNYAQSITQMVSSSPLTGRHDSETQREYSHSFEIWFEKAVQELIDAVTESSTKVRLPAVFLRIIMIRSLISPAQQKTVGCRKSGGATNPDVLQKAFSINSTPNDKEREMLASASGYTYKQVRTGSAGGCLENTA